jgi:calcineurin-like phosphoesterase family protein
MIPPSGVTGIFNWQVKYAVTATIYIQYINQLMYLIKHSEVQSIHKRMVRFQKLTRNLFLTLHGHNLHRQQRQLSKFLMR